LVLFIFAQYGNISTFLHISKRVECARLYSQAQAFPLVGKWENPDMVQADLQLGRGTKL